MEDLKPQDLGNGVTLVFQKLRADSTRIRAVVKDAAGNIVARGTVADGRTIQRSQFEAVAAWMALRKSESEDSDEEELDEEESEDV